MHEIEIFYFMKIETNSNLKSTLGPNLIRLKNKNKNLLKNKLKINLLSTINQSAAQPLIPIDFSLFFDLIFLFPIFYSITSSLLVEHVEQ